MLTNSYIVNTPSGQYTIQQQPAAVAGIHQPQQIIHHVIPQQRPSHSSFHNIHHNERPLVRGKTSPYGFFVKMCYEEHKKKYPNECVQVTEISKKCSQKWKTMTDDEKKRFFELAQKDAERYQAEVQAYGGEEVFKKKKRAKKDPNAPKRALSAFFFFSNEKRQEVSAEHPEWKVGQIAQELGIRWKNLPEDERVIFEKRAQEDKERYADEMRAYRNDTSQSVGSGKHYLLGQQIIVPGQQAIITEIKPSVINDIKQGTEHIMQAAPVTTTMVSARQPPMVIMQQQPQQGQPGQLPMQILEEHMGTTSSGIQQQMNQSQQSRG